MREPLPPRSRFYDGRFYAVVLDRFVGELHQAVAEHVRPGESVLDVGCGTGDLAFRIAGRARSVIGVELSPAMVAYAQARLARELHDNVRFVLGDVAHALGEHEDDAIDVATMVLALHEMPTAARVPVVREVTRVARRLLCLDYRAPVPWTMRGTRTRLIELMAGAEHFGAFLAFHRQGGIAAVAREAGLECRRLGELDGGSFEIAELTRARGGR